MYSVVLMAALTTGADMPSWGCHGARWGCRGAYGCNGCYGGCNGCNGCYGGWGCCGGYRSSGWSGCYGGCYGGGCYGCYGGWNGYNGGVIVQPGQPIRGRGGYAEPIPAPADDKQKKPAEPGKDSKPKEKEETSVDTQAKLIVELPADAKLYIDNKLMQSTAARRVFATPRLEPGRKYYYVLRAEVVRDGKPLSDTKQVIFQAGDEVRESFAKLALPGPADKVTAKAEE